MTKTHDYTWQGWGHSFNCFSVAPPLGSFLSRAWDKFKNKRRYTALIHNQGFPKVGDKIIYKADRGKVVGKIYLVEWLHNPRDMYKIYFEVTE
jgi:hypothetical protein